jgi:D-alanine transaminase
MPDIVYLNGEYLPRSEAKLPIDDRGFYFGDGIYEATRAHDGRLYEPERHFRRLAYGLSELRIQGAPDAEQLLEIHDRVLQENGAVHGPAVVYTQVTRGVAARSHQFPSSATKPTVYVSVIPYKPHRESRERGVAAVTYPDIRWARCDLKTVNLLPNVLARQHAAEVGVTESIFVRDGAITEGSHTNVFAVLGGELRTHPLSNYILGGVTRDVVIEIARDQGIPVREFPFFERDLDRVEELFLTGTTTDVTPIVRLNDKPVASGEAGPIARSLYHALMERIEGVSQYSRA